MSKITNDGLTRSGKECTQIATVGVKGLKLLVPPLSHPTPPLEPPQLQKCRTATEWKRILLLNLTNTDSKTFSKDSAKDAYKKATNHVNKIGNCVADQEICDMVERSF